MQRFCKTAATGDAPRAQIRDSSRICGKPNPVRSKAGNTARNGGDGYCSANGRAKHKK
jgi:hypothetical protein